MAKTIKTSPDMSIGGIKLSDWSKQVGLSGQSNIQEKESSVGSPMPSNNLLERYYHIYRDTLPVKTVSVNIKTLHHSDSNTTTPSQPHHHITTTPPPSHHHQPTITSPPAPENLGDDVEENPDHQIDNAEDYQPSASPATNEEPADNAQQNVEGNAEHPGQNIFKVGTYFQAKCVCNFQAKVCQSVMTHLMRKHNLQAILPNEECLNCGKMSKRVFKGVHECTHPTKTRQGNPAKNYRCSVCTVVYKNLAGLNWGQP